MMWQRHNTTERSSKTLINYTRRRAHALPSQRRLKNEIRTTYKRNSDRQRRSTLDAHKKKKITPPMHATPNDRNTQCTHAHHQDSFGKRINIRQCAPTHIVTHSLSNIHSGTQSLRGSKYYSISLFY